MKFNTGSRHRIYGGDVGRAARKALAGRGTVYSSRNFRLFSDSSTYLQNQGRLTLYGYVILENHCHLLVAANLGQAIASFKFFTAGQIMQRLTERQSPVLELLAFHKARHKMDRDHQV